MKVLNKQEVFALFELLHREKYKKRGKFLYRQANEGESVFTIVSGKLETLKTAGADDIVLRNIEIGSSAEIYIVSKEKFEKRYEPVFLTDDTNFHKVCVEGKFHEVYNIDGVFWYAALAKGVVEASMYIGELIKFMAPWDEEMLCEKGDYLARPEGGDPFDIYRIEGETFNQTYGG